LARVTEVEEAVASWTAAHSAGEVMRMMQAVGVPAGMVAHSRTLMEDDPQLRHRGYWQRLDHPELGESTFTSPPFRLDGERVPLARPPLIGEHNEDVLSNILGYNSERIAALRASGALEC